MNTRMMARKAASALVVAAALTLVGTAAVGLLMSVTTAAEPFSRHVTADGRIRMPADFRSTMVHLGSWFVPEGEASGFHDVYTERESAEAYRVSGHFPDGATLVKELRAADAGDYTTGRNVRFATSGVKQTFVMVKDANRRFPANPLWGDGWGWALFMPDEPEINVAADYRSDCLGCHVPAREKDWIYTEAYPTLAPR